MCMNSSHCLLEVAPYKVQAREHSQYISECIFKYFRNRGAKTIKINEEKNGKKDNRVPTNVERIQHLKFIKS